MNPELKSEIENLIIDLTENTLLTSVALRKAKIINRKLNNLELEEFIKGELDGDYSFEKLPEYRYIWGEPTFEFKNSRNSAIDVRTIAVEKKEYENGKSTYYQLIYLSVKEIEETIEFQKKDENKLKLSFTLEQLKSTKEQFSSVLEQEKNKSWSLIRAWWEISPTSFPGMLFKIKEKLIDILLDINSLILEKNSEGRIYIENTHFDSSYEIIKLIELAKKGIIVIDGYVDSTTLKMLSSKKDHVKVKILTDPKAVSESLEVLVEKYNKQYKFLEIKTTKAFHDRFLIIDNLNYYQIGASLKDLGNKTFSFLPLKEEFTINGLKDKFNIEWNKGAK